MMNVFIELTNPVHGGIGWEFGRCLWSPERNRSGGDSWSVMRKPKIGDIIVHSYNTSSEPHIIQGLSVVEEECYITNVEPGIPGDWSGYDSYYRIELSNYTEIIEKRALQDFLDLYSEEIKQYHGDKKITGTFYDKNIKVAQKYLEKIDLEIFDFLLEFLKISDLSNFLNYKIEEKYETKVYETKDVEDDYEKIPERRDYIISRKIRDTKMIQELKEKYANTCQICGKSIRIDNDKFYSEGAHIKPLGSPHNGSDTKDNIIILCPNHHIEFDYGLITINHKNNTINHIDSSNYKKLNYDRKDINKEYLKYHNERIYKGVLKT